LALVPIKSQLRSSYSNAFKANTMNKYYELCDERDAGKAYINPYTAAMHWAFGSVWEKRKGYLSKWLKSSNAFREALSAPLHLSKKKQKQRKWRSGRTADFPDCEDELYVRFLFRRRAHGYACDHHWLIAEFHKVLLEAAPADYDGREYGRGWAQRFCQRYSITTQAMNNIKAQDPFERGMPSGSSTSF
jgi:hypothetical protein